MHHNLSAWHASTRDRTAYQNGVGQGGFRVTTEAWIPLEELSREGLFFFFPRGHPGFLSPQPPLLRIYVLFHLTADDGARRVEAATTLVKSILQHAEKHDPVPLKKLLLPPDSPLVLDNADSQVS